MSKSKQDWLEGTYRQAKEIVDSGDLISLTSLSGWGNLSVMEVQSSGPPRAGSIVRSKTIKKKTPVTQKR